MGKYRVIGLLGLGLLTGCVSSQPQQTVIMSRPSAFDTPLDGRWRKAHETRPMAILLGRVETTQILLPRKAVLEASCVRGRPRLRIGYDIGLKTGPIAVIYRFDAGIEQKGVVRVRGRRRNIVVIDYAPTATAALASLRTSTSLKVRAQRPPFEMHDAIFKWDATDKVLRELLATCQGTTLENDRKSPTEDDDDDEAIDGAIKDVTPEG